MLLFLRRHVDRVLRPESKPLGRKTAALFQLLISSVEITSQDSFAPTGIQKLCLMNVLVLPLTS